MSKDRTWFLIGKKLAGEASGEELSELEGLLRSDPDMHYALQNITDLWSLPMPINNDAEEAFNRHVNRLKEATKDWDHRESPEDRPDNTTTQNRSRKKLLIVSMAVAVLMIATIYWYYAVTKRETTTRPSLAAQTVEKNEVSTHNGSKTTINLPDGSKVWLNAGSVLTYDKNFGGDIREVALSGEAYFEVIPAITPGTTQKVPFVIHTQQIDIRVLGTAFNVKAYPGDKQTETSLIHGKVEVLLHDRPEKKFTLRPNEKLVVVNDVSSAAAINKSTTNNQPFVSISKLTYAPADSLVIETAWVQNKLVFDDESFLEIAEKMERWYNVEIVFKDVKKQTLHFSGSFTNETIQQALDGLSVSAPFHYSMQGNKITIGR
ncbi:MULTISPECIES: FecR family protein [Niastella]|uniref:FecR family protein n=1 Tax=Niastella soli TaxID=2821487 RepID=A0ABS3YNR7_9BACT|nr:FecR family protein [Niastella soli]MBO9199520.1 FecR family protein [Niastella soli]